MTQSEKTEPIYWQNHLVGYIYDVQFDMGYCEGKWIAAEDSHVDDFYKALSVLTSIKSRDDIKTNLEKQIWIGLGKNEPAGLVYFFKENRIGIRVTSHHPEHW